MKILSRLLIIALLMSTAACEQSKILARVDSEPVTLEEFEKYAERKKGVLGTEDLSQEERREVLESLIRRDVVYLYAKKAGYTIPEEARSEALKGLSLLDRFREKKDIEKSLMLVQMKRVITANIAASKEEVESYYRKNPEEFSTPALFKVYLVEVKEEEVRHVLLKSKDDPEAFDDMALKRVSPELREINRNAPFTPLDEFPEEMAPFLGKMKKGEIAGPVRVKRGIYLFKLVDKKPSKRKPLSDAYIEIEHYLTAKKQDEAFGQWYDTIQKEFNVQIIDEELL